MKTSGIIIYFEFSVNSGYNMQKNRATLMNGSKEVKMKEIKAVPKCLWIIPNIISLTALIIVLIKVL